MRHDGEEGPLPFQEQEKARRRKKGSERQRKRSGRGRPRELAEEWSRRAEGEGRVGR